MKSWIAVALTCWFVLPAGADAVLMKSGERYIGEVTEEGESLRIKNATFPDGILVKRSEVKTVYPKPEEMLDSIGKVVDAATAKYEEGKKAVDRNPALKAAQEMLFEPELQVEDAKEIYPAEKEKFNALLARIHDLRKMCRDAQTMDGPAVKDPPKDPEPKKDPPKKDPPRSGGDGPAPSVEPAKPPKAPVDSGDVAGALDAVKTGSPAELSAALRKVDVAREERLAAPMVDRLKTEADPQARAALKEALTKYSGTILNSRIDNALKGKNLTEAFRCDCAEVLSTKKEDKAIQLVSDIAFASEMRDTRDFARGLLANYGNASLKSASRYIHVPDDRTRRSAVDFVAGIGTPEAYGVLAQCLILGTSKELMAAASIDVPLRDTVCEKMISGGDTACPALVNALSNGNLRKWACYCLCKISGEGYAESDLKSWSTWWAKRKAENSGK